MQGWIPSFQGEGSVLGYQHFLSPHGMIAVSRVSKVYYWAFGALQALHEVNLTVPEGEVLGIIGQNGAGKTTLMKLLLGFATPTTGSISVLGAAPNAVAPKKFIGFLPENCLLYRYLTGREFLRFCGKLQGMSGARLEDAITTWAKKVHITEALDRRVGGYSKGMQQRLGIIQALFHEPKLVFLDEPMSGLDPVGRAVFKEVLMEAKARGATMILNSHILEDMEYLCDRAVILHRGRTIGERVLTPGQTSLETYFMDTIQRYDHAQATLTKA